jgi:hypothetical protein
MSEVTRILSALEQGDPEAADQLLPLVYEELRKLAAQKTDCPPTAARWAWVTCKSKPTSWERRRSSSWPQPVRLGDVHCISRQSTAQPHGRQQHRIARVSISVAPLAVSNVIKKSKRRPRCWGSTKCSYTVGFAFQGPATATDP